MQLITVMVLWICLLVIILNGETLGVERPICKTPLGTIEGGYKLSYDGRTFSAFEGIPYALPPVRELRFKEPQENQPWTGIWNATLTHECMQLNTVISKLTGQEDCLYLNVYVPRKTLSSNDYLDVIVNIHGGAFMLGSPEFIGPEFLMDRDIVYVTINYRLGIFGFLSTEDDVVPGNNGLKDQVAALKWVNRYIKEFGGNPDSVTLVGLSAGGASVHYHTLSPLSKGLYQKAVSQSGTALVPWALQQDALQKAKKLSLSVGCDGRNSKEFVNCMRQRSAKQLIQNVNLFYTDIGIGFPIAPFAPVIERESEIAFLTDHPHKLLEKGQVNDVPWMTSVTSEEGIFPAISLLNSLDILEKNWNEIVPILLDYSDTLSNSDKNSVSQKIKEFYFSKKTPSNKDYIHSLIKLFGDRYFKLGFEKSARLQAKAIKSPVYAYIYNYKGERMFSEIFGTHEFFGVSHGDDGFLLYNVSIFGNVKTDRLSKPDEKIKNFLVNTFTSFAKHGKPDIEGVSWASVLDSKNFRYMFIQEPDLIQMKSKEEVAPIEFWHSLPIHENENIITVKDEL